MKRVIAWVAAAEELTQRRKADAQAQAKQIVADAKRAGEEALAQARARAEAEVAGYLKEAEARASKQAEQTAEDTRRARDSLRKAAEGRMAEASALIVRRVVKV